MSPSSHLMDNKGYLLPQATKSSIASAVLMFANRLLSSTANATTSLPSNPSKVIPTQEALSVTEVCSLEKSPAWRYFPQSPDFSPILAFLRQRRFQHQARQGV